MTVGVQDGRVPVPQGAMPWLVVARQADVAASQLQRCVLASEYDERPFGAVAMVRLAIVGEIEQHGIVKHGAARFRHALETLDNRVNQRHVLSADLFAHVGGGELPDRFPVANIVLVDTLAFDFRKPRVRCAKLIDGKGHDVGHARDEGGKEHLGEPLLAIDGGEVVGEVLGIELWQVLPNLVGHRFDATIATTDRL